MFILPHERIMDSSDETWGSKLISLVEITPIRQTLIIGDDNETNFRNLTKLIPDYGKVIIDSFI